MSSHFIISQADDRPMYLQIIDQVKQAVALGNWSPGSRIPSIRELAVDLRVSVITVKRAYSELEREGVIQSRQGRGSFVTEREDVGLDLYREELVNHLNESLRILAILGVDSRSITDLLEQLDAK